MRTLITCALPYANGTLHFGHIAGAYLPGDCYARFKRLTSSEVLFICGSDEYGFAITLSAELAKRSPQEHVDFFHAANKKLFQTLNFSFDHYSRTTWEGHIPVVQEFFLDLLHKGHIEERVTEQLFSEADQKFLADRYVVGTCPKCGFENARGDECQKCGGSYEAIDLISPRSKVSGAPLIRKNTKHWFLLFDHFKEELSSWIAQKHWKPNVLNFAKEYIQDLKPRAITRDSTWGIPIPLPNTEGKVLYVWFDAPIGYISATKEWALTQGAPDAWKNYWLDPSTHLVQFVGKDNIPFHAVFFPAMIMGQNHPYKLVDELPANEFYHLEGKQFSKSDGWYIDLEEFFQHFTSDQIRYVIAANAPETGDSEFSWKDFELRCNSELLGKYGNFVNRVLVFLKNKCGGISLQMDQCDPDTEQFLLGITKIAEEAHTAYSTFHLRKAAALIMELSQLGNVYFDQKKPWALAKSEETLPEMHTVLAACLECIKVLSLIAFPILPETAAKALSFLGFEKPLDRFGWDELLKAPIPSGTLPEPAVLFSRVDPVLISQLQAKLLTHRV